MPIRTQLYAVSSVGAENLMIEHLVLVLPMRAAVAVLTRDQLPEGTCMTPKRTSIISPTEMA